MYMKHVCRNWSVNIGLMEVTSSLDNLKCIELFGEEGWDFSSSCLVSGEDRRGWTTIYPTWREMWDSWVLSIRQIGLILCCIWTGTIKVLHGLLGVRVDILPARTQMEVWLKRFSYTNPTGQFTVAQPDTQVHRPHWFHNSRRILEFWVSKRTAVLAFNFQIYGDQTHTHIHRRDSTSFKSGTNQHPVQAISGDASGWATTINA